MVLGSNEEAAILAIIKSIIVKKTVITKSSFFINQIILKQFKKCNIFYNLFIL